MYYTIVILFGILCILSISLLHRKIESFINSSEFDIYLINLPRSKDRLQNFLNFYKNMKDKVPYYYVEAIDAKKISNTTLFKTWPGDLNQSDTHNNYKALQLSVRKCFIEAKKNKSEWAIICEDDAELPSDLNFKKVTGMFPDSKIIYLDNRNRGGDGYVPGCCMNCVMYHKDVFDVMINELHPVTSKHFINYPKKRGVGLNDHYIPWLIKDIFKIKCSSYPIIQGHHFKSTVTV